MQEYAQKESKNLSITPFIQYKIYLEDLTNTVEICSNKCIENYQNFNLTTNERLCLEKCYLKTLQMNQFVNDELPNIFNREDFKPSKPNV
jgi:hypothetical protein